jgi:hypothetical protein
MVTHEDEVKNTTVKNSSKSNICFRGAMNICVQVQRNYTQ